MKLQTLIIAFFLAVGIFAVAHDGRAWNDFSSAKSLAMSEKYFHTGDLKAGERQGPPAGTNTDSSNRETPSDCCSGFPDFDPVAAVKPLGCSLQILVINFYAPSNHLALPDPSYPINKPPQNQSV